MSRNMHFVNHLGEWIYHMENTKGYGMKENLHDVITGGPEAAEKFFKGKK